METQNHPVGVGPGHPLMEFNVAKGRTACTPPACEQGLDISADSRTSEPLLGEPPVGWVALPDSRADDLLEMRTGLDVGPQTELFIGRTA